MTKLLISGLLAAVAMPALAQVAAPMAMHDHVMTRAEVQGHVSQMFARLDANRDGVIMQAEADAAKQAMGGDRHPRGDRQAMRGMNHDPAAAFDRMDANRDGMISRAEFTTARATRVADRGMAGANGPMRGGHGMGGMGGRMFAMADANHDGRVTIGEAQTQAFAHFDMMDTNRDGRVTTDERKAGRQQMQMHKGR